MKHGRCLANGSSECESNYYGPDCEVVCNSSMPHGNCSANGTAVCEVNFFGKHCERFCNESTKHGHCLANESFKCENIIDFQKNETNCKRIFTRLNCLDSLFKICSDSIYTHKRSNMTEKSDSTIDLLFQGSLDFEMIPEIFDEMSSIFGCVDDKWDYFLKGIEMNSSKSRNDGMTTVSFQFACNDSLLTENDFYEVCLQHKARIQEKIYPLVMVYPAIPQIKKYQYLHDWLSDSWRLMASILGVISMALCIVLVTEFGKLKYRKLIKGVSLSRHPTGKGVT
eukprot:XP_019930606.1 PREDICTED: uncharacterized protein LOC105347678 [Crassostrea gigas]